MARVLRANDNLRRDLSNIVQSGVQKVQETITDTLIDVNSGKIRSDLLPSIAVDHPYVVADIAERNTNEGLGAYNSGDIVKCVAENQTFVYDGSGGWVEMTTPISLAVATDVTLTSPAANQILKYNGTKWVNSSVPSSLATQPDVTLTSLQNNQILRYNSTSTKWVNSNENASLAALTDSLSLSGTEVTGSTLRYNPISGKYDYSKLYHADLLNGGTLTHVELETEISDLQNDVSALDTRLDSAEATITSHASSISTNTSDISSNSASIGALQFSVTGLQTLLTTKGDLIGYSTGLTRVPVGSSGQVLTCIPGNSTGIGWATLSSSGATYFDSAKLTDCTVSNLKHRQMLVNTPKVFTFGSGGVYVSTNLTSRTLISSTPVNVVVCCRCNYGDSAFYLAGSTSGVIYKSSNNGNSWTTLSTNLSSLGCTGIAYSGVSCMNLLMWDSSSNRFILAFIGNSTASVAYSNGADPTLWYAATGTAGDDCYGMSANADFSVIIVTTAANKIYRSTDHAVSFTEVASSAINYGISYSPSLDKFCGCGDNGAYISNTGGSTWSLSQASLGYDVMWLADFEVFITVSGSYVYTSPTGATSSWTQRGTHNLTSNRVANIQLVMGGKYIILGDNSSVSRFSYATTPFASTWTLVSAYDNLFMLDYHAYQNTQLSLDYMSDFAASSTVATNDIVIRGSSGYTTATGLTAKGSLLTRNSTDYIAFPVSTDGYQLVCDSGTTYGLRWAAPAASYVSPTVYTTKNTVTGAPITVSTDTKLYEITVGSAGKYMVSTYVRILTNSGITYAKLWFMQNSGGTFIRTGTAFAPNDASDEDFILQQLSSAVTDSTFISHTSFVTTTANSAKIAVYGGVYTGSWVCQDRSADNTNFSGFIQCTGPF